MLISDIKVDISLDYDLIYSLINNRGSSKKSVAGFIGMTPDGFSRALKNQTLDIRALEKIAAFFDVHPATFFGVDPGFDYKAEVKTLKSIIHEKEKQIKDKEEIIQLLKQQLRKS